MVIKASNLIGSDSGRRQEAGAASFLDGGLSDDVGGSKPEGEEESLPRKSMPRW